MAEEEPKYPDVEVALDLDGPDGNAFAVIGIVSRALRRHGVGSEIIKTYQDDCMSGDYSHLLAVTEQWVVLLRL